MGVSSEMFSLVTVHGNLVDEHLNARGFDAYAPELPISIAVPEIVSTQNVTSDMRTIATENVPGEVADACAPFAVHHQLNVDDLYANVMAHISARD